MAVIKSKVKSPSAGRAGQKSKVSRKDSVAPSNSGIQNDKKPKKTKKVAGVNKIATSSEKVKKPIVKTKTTSNLSIPVYSLAGSKTAASLALPKEIFGAKVNKALLAQAMRVYLNNQKSHWSNTKTRGEVKGSTRKIFKQKGTGRARHGAIRAPIFVGGGIALGPKNRKVVLDLPAKMKNAALVSALAQKADEKQVLGISGLDKASGKTKEMIGLVTRVQSQESSKKSILIVVGEKIENAARAVRNITGVDLLQFDQINAYEVIKHQSLVLTKEAVEKLQGRLLGKKEAK
ncbi:50S ribosomal protein L4 [Candidatus Daviesbacteria bacterium]|nr:50S ribosomal protein L4 [Candidatus Daviesbacteria bacterium]